MILILLLYMLFASTFTFGKAALTYIQPIMFIALRMLGAGFLLLGYQYGFNRARWRFEWRDVADFANVSFFLMFLSFVTEFWAMQYVSAAKACLLYNLSPFITALLAYWLLQERLTFKQWIGLLIGVIGFVPILLNQLPTEAPTVHIGFISLPELALIVAVAASCYGWIAVKRLVVQRGYSTVMVNGVTMLFSGIGSLMLALFLERSPWIRAALNPVWGLSPVGYARWAVVGYTLLLIVIANVLGFNLYSWLLHKYSVTLISFAGLTAPLFAAFFDVLYFGQGVPVSFWVTTGVVGAGIYIFYQDELSKNS